MNLIEVHVAERTPEMEAIFDMNAPEQNAPGAGVVDHRNAELKTVLSPELAELVRTGKIRLVTYQTMMQRIGPPDSRRRSSSCSLGSRRPVRDDAAVEMMELR